MTRRGFVSLFGALPLLPEALAVASLFEWRLHIMAKARCENGPVMYVILQGKPFALTPRERAFLTAVADSMQQMESPHMNCTPAP